MQFSNATCVASRARSGVSSSGSNGGRLDEHEHALLSYTFGVCTCITENAIEMFITEHEIG
jgi:hypothetical protein